MTNKFTNLLLLTRLNSPVVYFCYFFPAAFGLMLAYKNNPSDLLYLLVFIIGSIITRGAGCIINDLFDRNLDKKVARTKNRPIASGAISVKEAIILLFTLLSIGLLILVSLNITSIVIGFVAVFLTTLYPLMKRITYFPQVFLGITINLGCLIGYAVITDNISMDAMILYFACGFWTVGYDTIYAFMDIKDDKKVGIKSTAIFVENMNYKAIILALYLAFILLFAFATWNTMNLFLSMAIILSILGTIWIVYTLDITQESNCLARFKANNYIGFILFLGLLLEKL